MSRRERLPILPSDSESSEEESISVSKRPREKQIWVEWEKFHDEASATEFLSSNGFTKHSVNKANEQTGRKVSLDVNNLVGYNLSLKLPFCYLMFNKIKIHFLPKFKHFCVFSIITQLKSFS